MSALLTTVQCPKCNKVYITRIVLKQTVAGARPILLWPKEVCDGVTELGDDCGYEFEHCQVESFDIPININPDQIIRPGGQRG